MPDPTPDSPPVPPPHRHRWAPRLQRRWRLLLERVGFESDWYLVILAAVIGTLTAVFAVGFVWLLDQAQNLIEHFARSDSAVPWWLLLGTPVLGALVCGLIVHFGAPEARGHGVPEVMAALYRNKARIRPRVAIFKMIASVFTIGSGGSAGAEGPIVQIGSAIGSNLGRVLRISTEQTGTLLGCGAAAGIAAVFNAPIAGIFFVLEVLMRDFSLKTFAPIVVASVFSAATMQAIVPHENGAVFAISNDLAQYAFQFRELPFFLLLGLVCGVAAVTFTRSIDYSETIADRLKIHGVLKPVIGATMLWAMSVPIFWLMRGHGMAEGFPPFYGNGYSFIMQYLDPSFYESNPGFVILGLLILFMFLKMIATCMTLGSGGSGGIFAPSLFIGAACGGAFGALLKELPLPGIESVSPAAFALVGMAAVVAATTHAPLAAMLMLFEMTGDYKVILPIMLAAIIATIVSQLIFRDSIYTVKLRRRGVRVGTMTDLTLLRRIRVRHVPLGEPVTVRPEEPAQRLITLAEMSSAEDFVVVNNEGRYVGMVTGEDLRIALLQIEAIPLLVVEELMRTDVPTTTREETLDVVMDKFSQHDASSLAVIEEGNDERVVGLITRARMMRQYHRVLDAS